MKNIKKHLLITGVALAGVTFGLAFGGLIIGLPGGLCMLMMSFSGAFIGAFAWANWGRE